MAQGRKDNKGRALRKGETYRKGDKRYVYNYRDPYGNNKSIYAYDLQTLRKKEEELIKDQLDGLDVYAAGKATLNYTFDRYMATKVELRKTTRSAYNYNYNHFVRDTFGKRLIAEIKYSDVMYFYLYLINEKGLELNTVDKIHTLLHPTFELAVRDEIIRNNPSNGVIGDISKKAGKNKGVRHALTLEQQRQFMRYVAETPNCVNWWPLFAVLLGTGCRIGEVVGLRWQDCDFENRLIDVNHSVVYYPAADSPTKKSTLMVSKVKTPASVRVIPMLDEVYEALMMEREDQENTGFNTTVIDGMSGFIFKNRYGNVHNPQSINRAIHRITEDCNQKELLKAKREHREPVIVPNFSCHIFRHTFCTRLCENESNLKVIQSVMGHSGIETTMDVYAEATESKKKEAMQNLSKNVKLF